MGEERLLFSKEDKAKKVFKEKTSNMDYLFGFYLCNYSIK